MGLRTGVAGAASLGGSSSRPAASRCRGRTPHIPFQEHYCGAAVAGIRYGARNHRLRYRPAAVGKSGDEAIGASQGEQGQAGDELGAG